MQACERQCAGDGRQPDDARAIAVVRIGQGAADQRIGQKRQRAESRQFAKGGRQSPPPYEHNDNRQQRHAQQRQRIMQLVDRREREFALLLARRLHRRLELRRVVVHDEISVPGPMHDTFAGMHVDQLTRGGDRRGFELQRRIIDQALNGDVFHLLAETGEAAEPVEQRTAPEPDIGVARQRILVGAQPQLRVGAMVVEIFIDDAILQHAAERQRKAARRPCQAFGDRVIGGEHYDGAEQ